MKRSLLIFAAVFSLTFHGCSGETVDRLPVFKVKGKVTLNGAAVSGADVTFSNKEANKSAFGKTNENGEYQLTTFAANDGAVAGKQDVSVVHVPPIPSTPALPSVEDTSYQPPGIGQSTMPAPPKSKVPAKYADAATSGLIAVVNEDNDNVVNLELTE